MSSLRHTVLDQNVLRRADSMEAAMDEALRLDEQLVLPDIALAEMMKSQEWEGTTARSLAVLTKVPERVSVGLCLGDLLRQEQESGVPATDVLDRETTRCVRQLLVDLQSGAGPSLDSARREIGKAQSHARDQHFAHSKNQERVSRMRDALREELTRDELKAIRRGDEQAIRAFLAGDAMTATYVDALEGAGYERKVAAQLATARSVTCHNLLALASLAFKWLDGWDKAEPSKITNDLADMDYVITALSCRRLLTLETRMNDTYMRLVAVYDIREAAWQRRIAPGAPPEPTSRHQ